MIKRTLRDQPVVDESVARLQDKLDEIEKSGDEELICALEIILDSLIASLQDDRTDEQ